MIENISKKQEKIQEKVQKQQELNDKDCRELTDEELEQVVGGMKVTQLAAGLVAQLATVQGAKVTWASAAETVQLVQAPKDAKTTAAQAVTLDK